MKWLDLRSHRASARMGLHIERVVDCALTLPSRLAGLAAVRVDAYARQAKDSELIQYATEIKVRAERRCGELLAKTEKKRGAAGIGTSAVQRDDRTPPTLDEMGLTKNESSRYQQLAAMPAEHFETAVATAKATAGEVTTAFGCWSQGCVTPEHLPVRYEGWLRRWALDQDEVRTSAAAAPAIQQGRPP